MLNELTSVSIPLLFENLPTNKINLEFILYFSLKFCLLTKVCKLTPLRIIFIFDFLLIFKKISFSYSFAALIAVESLIIF